MADHGWVIGLEILEKNPGKLQVRQSLQIYDSKVEKPQGYKDLKVKIGKYCG